MINEYLFLSNEHRAALDSYKSSDALVEICDITNTSLWTVSVSTESNAENAAKKLSNIHTDIMQYSPLVLTCESSEYFNKRLFPFVNELERKLRKLLYLAASISNDKSAKENIKQLEEKDFGELFDLLFIDVDFIRNFKSRVNADSRSEFNGKNKYSKNEIKSYLESLPENTLWDKILSKDDVPTLRAQFRNIQNYRNDVMHAHNMQKEAFDKALLLFKKVNDELHTAIGKLIGTVEENDKKITPNINTAISSALTDMNLYSISDTTSQVLQNSPLQMNRLMEEAINSTAMWANIDPAVRAAMNIDTAARAAMNIDTAARAANDISLNTAANSINMMQKQFGRYDKILNEYSKREKLLSNTSNFSDSVIDNTDSDNSDDVGTKSTDK